MKTTDPFLADRLARYDKWLGRGQIAYSARVIPIAASLDARQWVLPAGQVLDILRAASLVALQPCECRTHYGRCDRPVDTCFVLNRSAERAVAAGVARPVTLAKAAEVLAMASASGLIHLSLYMPDHQVYAVCNCCPCCCHDLQLVRHHGRPDLVRSDYVAVTDLDQCTACGDCVPRCLFGARTMDAGRPTYDAGLCLGCGQCVGTCAAGATRLERRA